MTDRRRRVLFLCTGNSCRSQMAEALLRHLGGDRFEACSAGSNPAGFVHELALRALAQLNVPAGEARSKSWDEFAEVELDVVITLCDYAAAQACPTWHGPALRSHWPLPDPATFLGAPDEMLEYAVRVARRLSTKIEGLVKLDFRLPRAQLQHHLDRLGEI
jgi:arsenate reductase